jgi:hypothetical protein
MNDIQKEQKNFRWFGHMIVFAMVLILALKYLRRTNHYGMLDYAILPFHEAGHFVFGIFGMTPGIAGGTIVQIGLPLAFAIYFAWWKKEYFAGMVAAFWMSQTLLNVATYMKDSKKMLLPLFGGSDDVIHDWNYLFGRMHKLHVSTEIGQAVEFMGKMGIWICLIGMVVWLVRTSPFYPAALGDENSSED